MKLSSETRRALEITRDEAKGVALSNKDNPNCDWASYRAQFIQETLDAYDSVEAELAAKNQRMWDLVHVERFLLHDLGLITDDELDLLASDEAAVKRLEDYDAAKAQWELDYVERIALLKAELAEAKALVAAAYLAAAEHTPKLNLDNVEPQGFWISCNCGWNSDGTIFGNETADWSKHILDLQPADAERSLQVYAQERVVAALTEYAKSNETCEHDNDVWYCDCCLHDKEKRQKAIWAAATARLAELKK